MSTWFIIACGRDEEVLLAEVTDGVRKVREIAQRISADSNEVTILVRNPDGETHWAFRKGLEVDL